MATVLLNRSYPGRGLIRGMTKAMCTMTIRTLNLNAMLQDPLIKLVMRSDNVSEQDHSDLLYRVQQSLVARCIEAQHATADVTCCVPA